MTDYLVITGDNCPYCDKAKEMLANAGLTYREINIMEAPEVGIVPMALGHKTVPLILRVIGGSDDLADQLRQI